jgi:hypothetical protein
MYLDDKPQKQYDKTTAIDSSIFGHHKENTTG